MTHFNAYQKLLVVIVCLWPFFSWAQDKKQDSLSVSSKIDSVYMLQKQMYKESKDAPLTNKDMGIELNFVRLLWMERAVNLSGGFSLFGVTREAEIAFPIYYSSPEDPKDLKELTIDCHYRNFLGNTQNGFYLSGFVRYAHLKGYLGNDDLYLSDDELIDAKSSENKIGIGVGMGYRKFSYKGLYWGTSLSLGRYFIGRNDQFYGSFLSYDDDSKIIVDFEFLKFGWAF
ncbi:MAG: hypothetical protein V1800_10975 [Candidatus Latescibacterota bacterium]